MNLSYFEIWKGIDNLALKLGLSPSALAQKSGLDPTAFNKSKRIGADGRKRWLSMESLNKVLQATSTSFLEFMALAGEENLPKSTMIPLLGFAQAGRDGYFDDAGFPTNSEGWDGIEFPVQIDKNVYALEVSGHSMEPVYREGDRLIVSPESEVRTGDRIVVKTKNGEVMVKELIRKTARQLDLKSLNPEYPDCHFNMEDILWLSRVLWVSQ
ncbi:MAG: helix-turn-helix transcriptional regulator [Alphaproteobacteria bacterium]|nr:helix-turn-helix transcriptional regulator [Alphaproteobacteria bacterium]